MTRPSLERSQRTAITEFVGKQAIMTERQVALFGSIGLLWKKQSHRSALISQALQNFEHKKKSFIIKVS